MGTEWGGKELDGNFPREKSSLAFLWMHGASERASERAWTSFGSLELCVSKLNFSSVRLASPLSPRLLLLSCSPARSCPLSFQGISSPAALSLLPSFPPFSFLPSLSPPALHLRSRRKLLRSTEVNYKSILSLSLSLSPSLSLSLSLFFPSCSHIKERAKNG